MTDRITDSAATGVDHADIHEILGTRWSPRAFQAQPVAATALQSIFEAARWAPSSGNSQPWSFLVATSDQAGEHERLASILNERNHRWAHAAPVLGLSIARTRDGDRQLRHGEYDTGQAMAMLLTQATALGLYVHQMAGFDSDAARREFSIPADREPMAAFALGYRGDPAGLPDDLRERETAVRTRQSQRSFVFGGRFGRPATFAIGD